MRRCPPISIHALREEGDAFWLFLQYVSRLDFYPRPPRGGRHLTDDVIAQVWAISIHALREEGDSAKKYNSAEAAAISIHALREEGDGDYFGLPTNIGNISIHALREEGDLTPLLFLLVFFFLFLSTPSARRATAKTERKHPAFVSLYTSLHKLQRDACKTNRKITPLLAQTAGIPVRSVPENYVCCRFALAGHQKISTLSWANSGCSPTCSTFVW